MLDNALFYFQYSRSNGQQSMFVYALKTNMILDILMDLLVMNKDFDNSKIRCQSFQSSDAKQTKFKDFISSIILAFDGN